MQCATAAHHPPCHAQEVKAALDDAIAAFARRPELAAALWERLLQSVVVAPSALEDGPVARYDITYQLNEIEVCAAGAVCQA